jgi:hypothetical protein
VDDRRILWSGPFSPVESLRLATNHIAPAAGDWKHPRYP